jgi:uncharacterized SAM-dependent methyltransferase
MKYFKNTELAKLYNISEKSVRNWIDAAEQDKLDLELYELKGKKYVADTMRNNTVIKGMVEKGRKYRNTRAFKAVTPGKQFYDLFSESQIIDIISNIDIYREIPNGYTYFGVGAEYWDKYAARLFSEDENNTLTSNIEMVRFNLDAINTMMAEFSKINVIDVGIGNALPAKELLESLHKKGKLNRYIGVDISDDMLDIAESHVNEWFGGTVQFERYVRDINYERFGDILVGDSFGREAESTANIFLFFGATILNFREPDQVLHTIRNSMGKNDLLITFLKLDTLQARRFFDFNVKSDKTILSIQDKFILDLMDIDHAYYDVEQFYDTQRRSRIIQARLKVALNITFTVGGQPKTVELHKGEVILLWRAWHFNDYEIVDKFDKNNFSLLQATKSKSEEYLLLINRLKTTTRA